MPAEVVEDVLFRVLHNEGDGGIWESFDDANARLVAQTLVPAVQRLIASTATANTASDTQGGTDTSAATSEPDSTIQSGVGAAPKATTRFEYGVERSFPSVRGGEPYIEWGASVGMSHHDEYTADSVHALAGGKPVFRRTRTSFSEVVGEPERFTRADVVREDERGAGQ